MVLCRFTGTNNAHEDIMEHNGLTSDFHKIVETVRIPLVITTPDLDIVYANDFSREVLPLGLEDGKKLKIEEFFQHEDLAAFLQVVSECKRRGESVCTIKQKGAAKYYKVEVYNLRNQNGEMVFRFEDVSQSRILEDEFYEHLVDLYSQLETQEREIADLKAILLRTQGD